MSYPRELLKGNTQTLILAVLQDSPCHGYAIARKIERRSEYALKFREGTLYPALHALERDGLVTSRWETDSGGPARKVYALTETGHTEFERRTRLWSSFSRAVDTVISGEPHAKPI
jgi:PadR family transcriptional regulator PadR